MNRVTATACDTPCRATRQASKKATHNRPPLLVDLAHCTCPPAPLALFKRICGCFVPPSLASQLLTHPVPWKLQLQSIPEQPKKKRVHFFFLYSSTFCTRAVSNCVKRDGTTSYAVLKLAEWNFDVEHVDMMLRHKVEYTGSMSRLPILVPECSKGRQLEGGGVMPNRTEIWHV